LSECDRSGIAPDQWGILLHNCAEHRRAANLYRATPPALKCR